MVSKERADEHQPLRQQEERSREHVGHCPADGQRVPAESRDGARTFFLLLHPAHRSYQPVARATSFGGSAPDIPWYVATARTTDMYFPYRM